MNAHPARRVFSQGVLVATLLGGSWGSLERVSAADAVIPSRNASDSHVRACRHLWLPILKADGGDHDAPHEMFRRLKGRHDDASLRQLRPAHRVAYQSGRIV